MNNCGNNLRKVKKMLVWGWVQDYHRNNEGRQRERAVNLGVL